MILSNRSTARAITAAATLLSAIVLATPLFAASGDNMATTKPRTAAFHEEMASTTTPESPTAGTVETRIRELHQKLKITDAQKTQWDALVQVMRTNAEKMAELEKPPYTPLR